jgi:uncharacterized repeat protein (TIGR03943 family)
MSSVDRSRATLVVGLLGLWVGGTNAMLVYLRPSMRPWLLGAAIGLVAIGIFGLLRRRRQSGSGCADEAAHDISPSRSRVGWLLVLPVLVVTVFGPQPMGEFAVGRTPHLPDHAFDIAAFASAAGTSVPTLRFADVLQGAQQRGNRDYLLSHDVTLRGFVSVPSVMGPGSFVLSRYLVACCAADAQPLSVTLVDASSIPPENQWAEVTGRLDPDAPVRAKYGPVLHVKKLELISEPAGPYESLR